MQEKHFREIGLKIASGITSFGNFKRFVTGVIILIIKSSTPEALNVPIATNNPISVGSIFTAISIPSFAPSRKRSNICFFSEIPKKRIIKNTKGIAKFEI